MNAHEWVIGLSHKWEVNRAESQAYVYYQPTATERCIIPVRFKPGQSIGSLQTRDWLADKRFAHLQSPLLHWLDAEYALDGCAGEERDRLSVLYTCQNGWNVNNGALRMVADWLLWEGGEKWAPHGPVVLYRPSNLQYYPLDALQRDWPRYFRKGMPYMRDDFNSSGEPHAQLQEAPSMAASQAIRFKTMCNARNARQRFGSNKWDQLNVY